MQHNGDASAQLYANLKKKGEHILSKHNHNSFYITIFFKVQNVFRTPHMFIKAYNIFVLNKSAAKGTILNILIASSSFRKHN